MSDWRTPPFRSLPEAGRPELRWVGTQIMDEEQYRVEGWRCRSREVVEFDALGNATRSVATYWTGTLAGYRAYGRMRAGRKAERRSRWQDRQDEELAFAHWADEQAEQRA